MPAPIAHSVPNRMMTARNRSETQRRRTWARFDELPPASSPMTRPSEDAADQHGVSPRGHSTDLAARWWPTWERRRALPGQTRSAGADSGRVAACDIRFAAWAISGIWPSIDVAAWVRGRRRPTASGRTRRRPPDRTGSRRTCGARSSACSVVSGVMRYGRWAVIASKASATWRIRASFGISSPMSRSG